MGCDIHLYKEKMIDGKWVSADTWVKEDDGDGAEYSEVPWRERFTDRNYNLFGLLCRGVRSEHPYSFTERGMPFDACTEIAENSNRWGCDGHSHSYLYLHELKCMLAFLETATVNVSGMKDKDQLEELRKSIASGNTDWNLLWPYRGWASSDKYEEFDIDVPANVMLGDCLKKIISGFDGIDGENHRIVFWFDN